MKYEFGYNKSSRIECCRNVNSIYFFDVLNQLYFVTLTCLCLVSLAMSAFLLIKVKKLHHLHFIIRHFDILPINDFFDSTEPTLFFSTNRFPRDDPIPLNDLNRINRVDIAGGGTREANDNRNEKKH